MKKRFLWIIIFFIIGAIFVYFITSPKDEKWTFDLPNDYAIKKTSDKEVVLRKYINNSFKDNNEKIVVKEYIAEFAYNDNYISLKCIEQTYDSINLKFYIIDSKNDNIYGPYQDEETYNKVAEKIIDEKLNDWIETITMPDEVKNM